MKRSITAWTAAILILGAGSRAVAQEFAPLDLNELREAAADYRHRAALLRRSVGLRDRRISEAESRASQIVANAQADVQAQQQAALQGQAQAQSNQDAMNGAAAVLGMFGGGGIFKSALQSGLKSAGTAGVAAAKANAQGVAQGAPDELAQAQRDAAPLREQSRALEGDKKKLAMKADQYEQLADAKDLLIAAETLRFQADNAAKSAGSEGTAIAEAKSFVEGMDIW